MVLYDPQLRPTAQDVLSLTRELISTTPGQQLEEWIENNLPPMLKEKKEKTQKDQLCDQVYLDGSGTLQVPNPTPKKTQKWMIMAVSALVMVCMVTVVLGIVVITIIIW